MTIRVIGVNHRTAPIELRERLAIAQDSLGEATRALLGTPGVMEGMILSTCNRVELVTSYEHVAPDVMDFLGRYFALDIDVLRPHLYEYEGTDAVRSAHANLPHAGRKFRSATLPVRSGLVC